MIRFIGLILGIAFLVMMVTATPSTASIIVGGIPFDDNAFADKLLASSGTWYIANASSLEEALVGPSLTKWASGYPVYDGWAKLGFTDNFIKNGVGNDLAVFENSGPGLPGTAGCQVTLTINGITQTYTPYWVENDIYLASINLDDFSIAAGGLVSNIEIWGNNLDPDYVAFGAINNAPVPLPGTLLLLGPGLLGLTGIRYRKLFSKK
jgi:hypothetical protein